MTDAPASVAAVFPVDQTAKIAALLRSADPRVLERVERHQIGADKWRGLAKERNARMMEATKDIATIKSQIAMFERELGRFARSTMVTNEAGEKELHPQLRAYEDKLIIAEKRLAQITKMPVGENLFDDVEMLLVDWPKNRALEWDADIPECPQPKPGKTLVELGNAEKRRLELMIAEHDHVFGLPVDQETAFKRIDDYVALRGRNIDIGGLLRGESVDNENRRSLRVLNPQPTVPQKQVVFGVDSNVEDSFGLMCALFGNAITGALRAQYEATESMSMAEKTKVIPDLCRKIWQQRCLVEVIAVACDQAGMNSFKRPYTPPEILIGVAPLRGYSLD